jgi:hypothetical protein
LTSMEEVWSFKIAHFCAVKDTSVEAIHHQWINFVKNGQKK